MQRTEVRSDTGVMPVRANPPARPAIRGVITAGDVSGDGRSPRIVPAVVNAVAILELLASTPGPVGVSQVARMLGLPKSSCHAILSTLEATGYCVRLPDQRWTVSLRLVGLGLAHDLTVDLKRRAEPWLEEVARECGWPSHLAIYDRGEVLYLAKAEGDGFIRFDTYAGKRAKLHLTALGKSIAACLEPAELLRAIEEHPLAGGTDLAIGTFDEMTEAVRMVEATGYAIEWEEELEGVGCIAAPIRLANLAPPAAVGIVALTSHLDRSSVVLIGQRLRSAAAALEDEFRPAARAHPRPR